MLQRWPNEKLVAAYVELSGEYQIYDDLLYDITNANEFYNFTKKRIIESIVMMQDRHLFDVTYNNRYGPIKYAGSISRGSQTYPVFEYNKTWYSSGYNIDKNPFATWIEYAEKEKDYDKWFTVSTGFGLEDLRRTTDSDNPVLMLGVTPDNYLATLVIYDDNDAINKSSSMLIDTDISYEELYSRLVKLKSIYMRGLRYSDAYELINLIYDKLQEFRIE